MSDSEKIVALEDASDEHEVRALLRQAKQLASRYYALTTKPLGVTGEVAEYEAAEKLGLTLESARTPAFDAFRQSANGLERFQIKGRAVLEADKSRGRVPSIKDGDFEAVLLVLLNKATLDALEIWQADRVKVIQRLDTPAAMHETSGAPWEFRSLSQSRRRSGRLSRG